MRSSFLPFSPTTVGMAEMDAVNATLESGWLTTGPVVKEFEDQMREYLSAPAALALNSCTSALHIALHTHAVKAGDEVITTPLTFAATANVIEHVGAKPVFVDVQQDTLNIDPVKIEAAITPKTKAIIPVHYAGHPVDMDEINDIAERNDLLVIEDAAHAIPAAYKGRAIGSNSNPVAFSFYATKNLTTGEGGMLTGAPEFLEKAKILSLHGMTRDAWKRYEKGGSWAYQIVTPGFKCNMTDIQAAMGLVQLNRLADFQSRRREIVGKYFDAFKNHPAIELPACRDYVDHAWHLFVIRLNLEMISIDRNQFIEELAARNIGSSVHFTPLHMQPYYRDKYSYKDSDFPVANRNFHRMISLPLSPALSNQDIQDVIDATTNILKAVAR